ncbi:MAG TPA: transposase, partial [Gammaproteobacteria bacterium]
LKLFAMLPEAGSSRHSPSAAGRVFIDPDPAALYLGQLSLQDHLRATGIHEPFLLRRLLGELDWTGFEARYAPAGRAPYAPRSMLGLILYGILQGVSSLRGLERLARLDLGAMWVSGGVCPDHANIGRFITLQDELLTGAFFIELTRRVLQATGTGGGSVAGDGTVIEAACSHYGLLKEEAARQRLAEARAAAAQAPADKRQQAVLAQSQQAHEVLQARQAARASKGKASDQLCIGRHEPEAVVQPLQRGRGMGPSYKPSVLANAGRVVVGMAVDPSSETRVLETMLAQSAASSGEAVADLLLDAGYFSAPLLAACVARNINLLCPEGQVAGQPKRSDKYFPKGQFVYDEYRDAYQCPQQQWLTPLDRYRGNDRQPGYVRYATPMCRDCPVQAQCTRGQRRAIKRYAGDELKDALRGVMQQPPAQAFYVKRQAMVEPVFSALRERQGLNRFRRRGLAGVRREFALPILAYNLGRAVVAWLTFIFGLFAAVFEPLAFPCVSRRIVGSNPRPLPLAA